MTDEQSGEIAEAEKLGPQDVASSSVVFSMRRRVDGALLINTIEMRHTGMRTRCIYTEDNSPHELLTPELADVISVFAAETGGELGVVAKPDYALNLPGLMLSKARVLVTRAGEGDCYVMVRFSLCYGNVTALFSTRARPWRMGHDQSQVVAAEALEKIFLPLMNFADHVSLDIERIREEGSAPLAESLERTRQRIDDLELYYNMLVDFVGQNNPQPRRHTPKALGIGNPRTDRLN